MWVGYCSACLHTRMLLAASWRATRLSLSTSPVSLSLPPHSPSLPPARLFPLLFVRSHPVCNCLWCSQVSTWQSVCLVSSSLTPCCTCTCSCWICCSFGCEPDLPLLGCMSMKQLLMTRGEFSEHVKVMEQPIRGVHGMARLHQNSHALLSGPRHRQSRLLVSLKDQWQLMGVVVHVPPAAIQPDGAACEWTGCGFCCEKLYLLHCKLCMLLTERPFCSLLAYRPAQVHQGLSFALICCVLCGCRLPGSAPHHGAAPQPVHQPGHNQDRAGHKAGAAAGAHQPAAASAAGGITADAAAAARAAGAAAAFTRGPSSTSSIRPGQQWTCQRARNASPEQLCGVWPGAACHEWAWQRGHGHTAQCTAWNATGRHASRVWHDGPHAAHAAANAAARAAVNAATNAATNAANPQPGNAAANAAADAV